MSTDLKSLFAAYSVRNVKTFTGVEGRGFSTTLCRDNKVIATVLDDAWGGCLHFSWIDNAEEETLRSRCAAVPASIFEGLSIPFDMDQLVNCLVDEYEDSKRLKRLAKKKTLFRIKGDGPGEWRTLNVVGPRAMQYLATEYGDQLETVYGQGAGA